MKVIGKGHWESYEQFGKICYQQVLTSDLEWKLKLKIPFLAHRYLDNQKE